METKSRSIKTSLDSCQYWLQSEQPHRIYKKPCDKWQHPNHIRIPLKLLRKTRQPLCEFLLPTNTKQCNYFNTTCPSKTPPHLGEFAYVCFCPHLWSSLKCPPRLVGFVCTYIYISTITNPPVYLLRGQPYVVSKLTILPQKHIPTTKIRMAQSTVLENISTKAEIYAVHWSPQIQLFGIYHTAHIVAALKKRQVCLVAWLKKKELRPTL